MRYLTGLRTGSGEECILSGTAEAIDEINDPGVRAEPSTLTRASTRGRIEAAGTSGQLDGMGGTREHVCRSNPGKGHRNTETTLKTPSPWRHSAESRTVKWRLVASPQHIALTSRQPQSFCRTTCRPGGRLLQWTAPRRGGTISRGSSKRARFAWTAAPAGTQHRAPRFDAVRPSSGNSSTTARP